MTLTPLDEAHLDALAALLPEKTIGAVPEPYLSEPRGRFQGHSTALARPGTVEEVAEILRYCNEHRIGVIPYGGGTGLVGGQVGADDGTLLLSLERMRAVREIDPDDNAMIVEAGAILTEVHAAAEGAERLFPLTLASQGSARIGGLLGTNAGGVQVLRYGNARELCLGVEAVLADGRILHGLKRLRKDNTGYDLRNLLVGSEGTLGVITAATLRLFPQPVETQAAMVEVEGPRAALALLGRLRRAAGETLSAFELIGGEGLRFLDAVMPDTPIPFAERPDWSVLCELSGGEGAGLSARLETALMAAIEAGEARDALIAQNESQRAAFWAMREGIPEANRLIGAIASHDISVPISKIPDFIEDCGAALAGQDPTLRINCFGHVGDGNLHYNLYPPEGRNKADYTNRREAFSETVHEMADRFGGSISAEHGIGRLKVEALERFGDPVKLAAMRQIKAALDPNGILNPGAVLRP